MGAFAPTGEAEAELRQSNYLEPTLQRGVGLHREVCTDIFGVFAEILLSGGSAGCPGGGLAGSSLPPACGVGTPG